MREELIIGIENEGKRLDQFLSETLKISRAKAQELIKKNYVKINNSYKQKSYRLKINDKLELLLPESYTREVITDFLIPQNIPIEILYEDEYLVVLSKPPGMVVYPCLGHRDGTLMNAVAYHLKKLASVGGPLRPGVVHRLDKDTSGAIIIALDDNAYYRLVEMFKKRLIRKEYLTLVYGEVRDYGKITSPIGRSTKDRKKMSTKAKNLKEAITEWRVIKRFANCSLLKVRIITGRTHQIRVHFSSMGHPILGDSLYGRKTYLELKKEKIKIPRQMLHSHEIEFIHPLKEEIISLEAPIPKDMGDILKILEGEYGFRQ